ncbi:TPA: hypothetical protein L3V69_002811 [Vibrio parahaemolyticus]|uniref:DNA topoisomerase III n=2 Tax=Vibrio harveyi group TaxID=717610 RepID=A0AA47JEL5_VIBPH|nr:MULTISPECIES: hypothetical protein [Vibrio harveyi group]ARR05772.1 DNA topoisomerase III [Vibrio campbellii]ELC3210040.1 hypothetical protein [Vibrio parahaemolyticus]MBE4489740.1 hypothetical protein [Vibrio parahaemolyticus]MBE4493719.1 hypothetical protein [Vibrio parahaemolyticus]MBE4503372.1 hypothetical protein [Vibrio parahaemolyticus]
MIVYIAEKPSLAKAIFEGLGGNPQTQRGDGFCKHKGRPNYESAKSS